MTSADTVQWSLLLPNTWSRIRLDRDRPQQVAALVGRAFANVSRDRAVELRHLMEQQLTVAADTAFKEGGHEFYLLSELRRGLPVAATCVVTVVQRPLPGDVPAEITAQVLASGSGEATTVTVAGEPVPAVRRSEPRTFQVDLPGLGKPRLTFTGLDVFVPFPDRSRILLLTFRTPVEPIAASMMVLFEAIAGSLRWQEEA
jgi:hypothetical protein